MCESDYNKPPKGVGWEVRKTTASGHGEQSAIIMDAIERMSGLKCNDEGQNRIALNKTKTKMICKDNIQAPDLDYVRMASKRLISRPFSALL